ATTVGQKTYPEATATPPQKASTSGFWSSVFTAQEEDGEKVQQPERIVVKEQQEPKVTESPRVVPPVVYEDPTPPKSSSTRSSDDSQAATLNFFEKYFPPFWSDSTWNSFDFDRPAASAGKAAPGKKPEESTQRVSKKVFGFTADSVFVEQDGEAMDKQKEEQKLAKGFMDQFLAPQGVEEPVAEITQPSSNAKEEKVAEPDEETKAAADVLETIQKAANQGSSAAGSLLSKIFVTEEEVLAQSNKKERLSDIFKAFGMDDDDVTSSKQQDPGAPVTTLLQSLHQASVNGSLPATNMLKQFFKSLFVDGTTEPDSPEAAAGHIFTDFFVHQSTSSSSSSPSSSETSKHDLPSFVQYLQNKLQSHTPQTAQTFLSHVFVNTENPVEESTKKHSQSFTGNIFTDHFCNLDGTAADPQDVEPNTPLAAFFEYLYRSTNKGSLTAADLLSQWLGAGDRGGRVFKAVFADQGGEGVGSSSSESLFDNIFTFSFANEKTDTAGGQGKPELKDRFAEWWSSGGTKKSKGKKATTTEILGDLLDSILINQSPMADQTALIVTTGRVREHLEGMKVHLKEK
ncbi:hypothetical protein HDV05_001125, partial [Chytridiales sp. JEL 0842]